VKVMKFWDRTMLSMRRKSGKTLTLFILIFILGNLISGAMSIQRAVQNTEEALRLRLPAVATIMFDSNAVAAARENGEDLDWIWEPENRFSIDHIREVGSLPYVRFYNMIRMGWMRSRDLVFAPLFNRPEEITEAMWDRQTNSLRARGFEMEYLWFEGIDSPQLAYLEEGLISLVEGRLFTQEELDEAMPLAIITQDFAHTNQLELGSRFTLENLIVDDAKIREELGNQYWGPSIYNDEFIKARLAVEFEVIGIVRVEQEFNYAEATDILHLAQEEHHLRNLIYIPIEIANEEFLFTIEHLGLPPEELLPNTLLFALNDSRDLGAFMEAGNQLLPEFFEIRDLSGVHREITASMDSLLWIADMVLWVTVGASIIILTLLILMFLRDRRSEIGIYLALGEKKAKVIFQMFLEVAIIGAVAITLSIFSGYVASGALSRRIIENDLLQEGNTPEMELVGGLYLLRPEPLTVEELMAKYDTSLDATAILQLFGAGIGTILISTTLPLLWVVRSNPKEILL